MATAAGAILLVPGATIAWLLVDRPPIPPEALGLGIVSGVLEAVYFAFLAAAYRRGDLSIVYPLARGTATLLAVGAGILILGERLSPLGYAGLGTLLVGFLWLQRPWQIVRAVMRGHAVEGGVLFAIATGVLVATYSAVDRVGVRLVEPWIYAAILQFFAAITLVGWTTFRWRYSHRRGIESIFARLAGDKRSALGGAIAVVQYLLILVAFRLAPLSVVAPLRESAIVLASGWGAFRMREAASQRDGLARVAAATLIVIGAVVIAAS
ncbi:MAG: hypothetical protein AABZ33_04575 [Chloroflexota bacterium]